MTMGAIYMGGESKDKENCTVGGGQEMCCFVSGGRKNEQT